MALEFEMYFTQVLTCIMLHRIFYLELPELKLAENCIQSIVDNFFPLISDSHSVSKQEMFHSQLTNIFINSLDNFSKFFINSPGNSPIVFQHICEEKLSRNRLPNSVSGTFHSCQL